MFSTRFTRPLIAAAFALSTTASVATAVERFRQPWTPDYASQESRVVACNDPTPLNLAAMDDFRFEEDGEVISVSWWGVVSQAAQRQRDYLIQFWSDENCRPSQPIQFECVTPNSKVVGQDCQGRSVVRFRAPLAMPFPVVGGTRYWFQVSEADEESVRPQNPNNPNAEDFRWSEHWPIRGCPAAQRDAAGNVFQPLTDACYDQNVDLAFGLVKRNIVGAVVLPFIPDVAWLEIRHPSTNALLESLPIEFDPGGSFEAVPELPDGTYRLVIESLGMKRLEGTVNLQTGQSAQAFFPDYALGDLDGDNLIGLSDLSLVLESFGL